MDKTIETHINACLKELCNAIQMASPLLLSSLSKYFAEHPKDALLLQRLADGTYPVSLRVMDWFVTHYSKIKNVIYWIDDRDGKILLTIPTNFHPHIRKFHLYYEYRAQLKSYTKLLFDPFRRHDRISFIIEKTPTLQTIETTAGQLNFFRWAIQNHILDYIQAHLADIEETMTHVQTQRKKRDGKNSPSPPTPATATAPPATISRKKASVSAAVAAAGGTVSHKMSFD